MHCSSSKKTSVFRIWDVWALRLNNSCLWEHYTSLLHNWFVYNRIIANNIKVISNPSLQERMQKVWTTTFLVRRSNLYRGTYLSHNKLIALSMMVRISCEIAVSISAFTDIFLYVSRWQPLKAILGQRLVFSSVKDDVQHSSVTRTNAFRYPVQWQTIWNGILNLFRFYLRSHPIFQSYNLVGEHYSEKIPHLYS